MPLEHFRIALSDIRTNFVPAPEHSAKKLGKFSHKVIRGQLDGSQSVWIKKEIGNLGLDDGNRVIKIDGDWCFAQSRNQYTYGLTPRMIDSLPYPIDFYAFNWLDIIMEGEKKRNSKIIDPSLTNAKQFRAEVNQAILKICLLPDSFIDHFVETYMSGAPNYYSKLIQDRRMELLNSALQNQAFKTYLETHEAEEDALSLSRQMGDIFANGNLQVLPISERETMAEEVRLHLKMLQKRNINELESLINK